MPLCNQGCKTHVYFFNNTPYNMKDHEPHAQTCMSLKMGKWWGGYYNTIAIARIKPSLENCYALAKKGDKLSVSQLLDLVHKLQSEMEFIMRQIRDQERWNEVQKEEFANYKTRLVAEQTLREERKRSAEKARGFVNE